MLILLADPAAKRPIKRDLGRMRRTTYKVGGTPIGAPLGGGCTYGELNRCTCKGCLKKALRPGGHRERVTGSLTAAGALLALQGHPSGGGAPVGERIGASDRCTAPIRGT
jgi:hypothetical protein